MQTRISKISLVVFCLLLVLSAFLLSTPGDYWPWYALMAAVALVPCAAGPKRYRVLGIGALLLSVVLIAYDYRAGVKWREELNEKLSGHIKYKELKGEPAGADNWLSPFQFDTLL